MRVLHLDSGRDMRGGQWQALRLHRGLVERDHESLLLARKGSALLAAAEKERLPCDELRALKLRMHSLRSDLVHAHDARSHTLGALFSGDAPLVVSRRVAFPVHRSVISRWKYRRPVLFLAVSEYVARQLQRAGIEETRIVIVHDGVPVPSRPAHGSAILVPQTLDPEKGMALAERAAALARVTTDRSSDLEADLPRARALVYLSNSEGLGSGILLAMAYGVTVIASKVGGIPELIQDGVNGILVPNETQAIADAFHRIDPALGRAARETVLARFTETQMIDHTVAAYAKVLKNA